MCNINSFDPKQSLISLNITYVIFVISFLCLICFCYYLQIWKYNFPNEWKMYDGTTTHIRRSGKKHKFTYSISLDFIDLDNPPFWGKILYFSWKDHAFLSLQEMKNYVFKESGFYPKKVYLLTELRFGGHCFNSISIYFIPKNNNNNEKKSPFLNGFMIYEVWNIPWFENVLYFHEIIDGKIAPKDEEKQKKMHVSPFNPIEKFSYHSLIHFDNFFPFKKTSHFDLKIYVKKENENILTATLNLKEENSKILRLWPTLINVFRIMLQAFFVWKKGNQVFYHKPKFVDE